MTTARRINASRRSRLLAVPLVAALVAASCGGNDDSAVIGDDAPDDTTAATDAPDDSPVATDAPDDTADGDTPETTSAVVDETIAPVEDVDPVFGGTLRYVLEAETEGINPTASALASAGLMMGNAVFDNLAATTPAGEWVPYLAESFTPSDDFMSWTMKVREGVTFHDGEPLNSAAVIANFEAQRQHPLVGLAVKPFFPEENAAVVIDDLTVQFNLLDANAYFPVSLAGQLGMVASPKWLEAALADPTLNQAPVGTGPFEFDSRSEDSVTRFVRNDSWWNGDVYLDAVEFFPVPDAASRTQLLFGGDADALQTTDQASILDLRDDESVQNVVTDAGEESFAMINSTIPPFDDIRAREALTRSAARQNYIDLIGLGASRGADQMFIPESPYHNPDVKQAADDPDAAIALAAAYCAEKGSEENTVLGGPTCTDGKINIELQWSGPDVVQSRIADILDEGWSVAFNVTFDELLQDEHVQQTAFAQYNVNTWRQFGGEDPWVDNVWLLCRTISGISLNWPRFCDEERDQLLLAAIATTDQDERVALYQQVVEKINQDYLYIFFYHTTWDNAFAENVHDMCERTSPEGEKLTCSTNGRTWFSHVWMD